MLLFVSTESYQLFCKLQNLFFTPNTTSKMVHTSTKKSKSPIHVRHKHHHIEHPLFKSFESKSTDHRHHTHDIIQRNDDHILQGDGSISASNLYSPQSLSNEYDNNLNHDLFSDHLLYHSPISFDSDLLTTSMWLPLFIFTVFIIGLICGIISGCIGALCCCSITKKKKKYKRKPIDYYEYIEPGATDFPL